MNTLEEYIRYYYTIGNYNCSEALIHAANAYYGLDIKEDDMKMMGGFGSGMYAGIVCGGLVGSVAALSKMIIEKCAREEVNTVRPVMNSMVKAFDEHLGGMSCRELRPKYYTKEESCLKTVLLAGEALEMTVNQMKGTQ